MTWQQVPSPNRYDVRDRPVDTIILHYTAGRGNAMSTAAVFANPKRKASAHFVVGRDGGIVQCVDLEDGAWHAGDGRMPSGEQLASLAALGGYVHHGDVPRKPRDTNMRSAGIEICNMGWAKGGPGEYGIGRHRNPASRSTRWETYPEAQVDAVEMLIRWITDQLPTIRWITGHEDVTHRYTLGKPGAKLDPGPMWTSWAHAGLRRVMFDFAKKGWVLV